MQIFKRPRLEQPSAFSVQPSRQFDDGEGLWSTFNLQVGGGSSGPQNFRAIVSTSSFDIWLPLPQGCPYNLSSLQVPDCPSTRGVGLYNSSQSTGYSGDRSNTSSVVGIFHLDMGILDISTLFGS